MMVNGPRGAATGDLPTASQPIRGFHEFDGCEEQQCVIYPRNPWIGSAMYTA
jgi:hypothetical protein